MTIVVNSLGVEEIKGPHGVEGELSRSIERTDYGFLHTVRVPFDSTGILNGTAGTSIEDVEFGKGAYFLEATVVVTGTDATETVDVGLALADTARAGDTFTADPDGLVAAGALDNAGLVAGAGALLGIETSARTKLTATLSAGTDTAAGYILLTYMGGSDYFDNIN